MTATSDHVTLRDDLVRVFGQRLIDPIATLLPDDPEISRLRHRLQIEAEVWAAQLLGRDDALAERVARQLVAALHPAGEPFEPPESWWRTPFGRAVARRVGHPSTTHVSFSVAGAMLGISRQGVHDLVTRGKLDRHPDGGVSTDSIRDRLAGRRHVHAR